VQLGSAIRKVHDEGMAVRMIDTTKILVTGKNQWAFIPCFHLLNLSCTTSLRISSTGIIDVLTYNPNLPPTPEQNHLLQLEDLHSLGCLLLSLCTSNLAAANNLSKTLEIVGRTYSSELKNVGLWLIGKGGHKVIGTSVCFLLYLRFVV
jgi:PAB-dependent poly(A)-specific ribonuclease subunit 3